MPKHSPTKFLFSFSFSSQRYSSSDPMSLSEELLDAWGSCYNAYFDNAAREGSYEPPPSEYDSRPCTPSGLLTPSHDDHGAARPTRIERRPESPPAKPTANTSLETEEARLHTLRLCRRLLATLPPDFFPRLHARDTYINTNPGIEHDWEFRSLRSKSWKQPYLFALDYAAARAGEAAVAVEGDDSSPSEMLSRGEDSTPSFTTHLLTC